jgi:hypothetical protein
VFALDFEAFAQDNDILASGLDTASTALPIDLEIQYGPTGGDNLAAFLGTTFQTVGTGTAATTNLSYSVLPPTDRQMFVYAMVDLILTLDSEGFMYSAK